MSVQLCQKSFILQKRLCELKGFGDLEPIKKIKEIVTNFKLMSPWYK